MSDVSTERRRVAASRSMPSSGAASAPGAPATAISSPSPQQFFDRRDPPGRGGIVSGIPFALGYRDQTVGFGHPTLAGRDAEPAAIDSVGQGRPDLFL